MNIFMLDFDPVTAAQMLCDKHVGRGPDENGKREAGKMMVEAAQMLANCYPAKDLAHAPKTQKGTVRKYSYFNHPCSIWVRNSIRNFDWLLEHAHAMVDEKMFRGGERHFCSAFFDWCSENPPKLPKSKITYPALAMPDAYQVDNFVEAYRLYYYYDKYLGTITDSIEVKWTVRKQPEWWTKY